MELLAHPFRVGDDGSAVTVTDGSPDHWAQVVAVTVLTRKGERPLVPLFGVADPAFADLDVAEVNANLATFGPLELRAELTDAHPVNDTTQALTFALIDTDDSDTLEDTDGLS